MEFIDTPKETVSGIINPETALVKGKLKATDIKELTRFQHAFPFKPRNVVEYARKMKGVAGEKLSEKEKADLIFTKFLPLLYVPSRVPGWSSTLVFRMTGIGDYTLAIDGSKCKVTPGAVASPACEISTDFETFSGILKYSILKEANQLEQAGFKESPEEDAELTDDMLDMVVGGRGQSQQQCNADFALPACVAEFSECAVATGGECGAMSCDAAACGGDTCGADACLIDACGGALCPAAACIVAGCGGDVCAGDACGGAGCAGAVCAAALCGGDVCGAAGCEGDACGAAGCPAEGCIAAACAGDLCGAAGCIGAACGKAICGADGCAGDSCGAEADGTNACSGEACGTDACGAEACAARACAVDVTGVDACAADFCAINVIPIIPGI